MGLLRSRSRSQRRFEIIVIVCLDDIFWITEHFVTKSGMVMQHHEPECHVGNLFIYLMFLLSSRSRSQRGLVWSKYDSFSYIFWTVVILATKLGQMIHHHKLECPVKISNYCIRGQGEGWRVIMVIFVQMTTPQWGAADAGIKVPSDENTEVKGSPFQAWSRSVYCHACYAYRQGFPSC